MNPECMCFWQDALKSQKSENAKETKSMKADVVAQYAKSHPCVPNPHTGLGRDFQ